MINVSFKGAGTWFNKDNGNLVYPSHDGTGSFFQFPPVYQTSGIFLLNDEDVETYRHTKNFDHVRELLPSKDHENSAFLKMVNEGIFTVEDADHLYFKLPRKRKAPAKSKFVTQPDVLVIENEVTTGKAELPVNSNNTLAQINASKTEPMVLVAFDGRGAWFTGPGPHDKYGSRSVLNFLFKDPETGETELTKDFFRLYDSIDQKLCNKYVGIFKLTKKDAIKYLLSKDRKDLSHVEELLPCSHPYSAFSIGVEEGYLSNERMDDYFFLIQRNFDRECFEDKKMVIPPYVLNNKLCPADELDLPEKIEKITANNPIGPTNTVTKVEAEPAKKKESENEKRLDSLRKFIEWLEAQAGLYKLDFSKDQLDCTKTDLFKALKVWEADHITTVSKRVWHKPKGWNSCGKLWDSAERKAICDIANDRQGRPKNDQPKNPENIFKKINMRTFI